MINEIEIYHSVLTFVNFLRENEKVNMSIYHKKTFSLIRLCGILILRPSPLKL